MSIPTKDDFLKAACRWNDSHQGIAYELSWHSRSEYSQQGTWCYYILLNEEQFYPDDWAKLRLKRDDKEFAGSWRRHWDYDSFPDLEPHGGWTFGEMTVFLGRDGKDYEHVKVGCDYAHLWDEEAGFWQGREAVERDAKRSIDLLIALFPKRRTRCEYSGKYDDDDKFYTAKNGRRIHVSHKDNFKDGWDAWRPATSEAA